MIAVSKAYKDRDRADLLAMKMDRVLKIQQEKLQTRHIVNAFKVCSVPIEHKLNYVDYFGVNGTGRSSLDINVISAICRRRDATWL